MNRPWFSPTPASPATMGQLLIGGGGFVTGISQAWNTGSGGDGTIVVRSDTAFAYRWDVPTSRWVNLMTGTSLPLSSSTQADGHVDCYVGFAPDKTAYDGGSQPLYDIQVAPSNGNRMYMLHYGTMFVSNNKGANWSHCAFPNGTGIWLGSGVYINGNTNYRYAQKLMAIHPTNPDQLIISNQGVTSPYYTTDAGATTGNWHIISGIPAGAPSYSFAYDPVTPTTIYCAVWPEIVSSSQVTFTGSITGTALTITGVAPPTLAAGTLLSGQNITWGTSIVSGSGSSYVVTPSQTAASAPIVFYTNAAGIYQTTTGPGGTWSLITNSPFEVTDLLVNGGTLFICGNPYQTGAQGEGANNLITYPGTGTTFTTAIASGTGLHNVAVNHSNTNHMVACDVNGAMFLSTNAGGAWGPISTSGALPIVHASANASAGTNTITFASTPSWVSTVIGGNSFVTNEDTPNSLSVASSQVYSAGSVTHAEFPQHGNIFPTASTATTLTVNPAIRGSGVASNDRIVFGNTAAFDCPWLTSTGAPFPAGMIMDVLNSDRIITCAGQGVWYTDSYRSSFDVTVTPLTMLSMTAGIENLSSNGVLAVDKGGGHTAVLVHHWDFGTMTADPVDPMNNYPKTFHGTNQFFNAGWGLDVAKDGSGVCVLNTGFEGFWGNGYSTDFGNTWDVFTTDSTLGNGTFLGDCAVSSSTSAVLLEFVSGYTRSISAIASSSGLVQITATGHNLASNQTVYISGVTGTGAANVNGNWVITVIDANNFTLNGSTFTGSPSGGTVRMPEFVYTSTLNNGATATWLPATTPPPLITSPPFEHFFRTLISDQVTANTYYWYYAGQGLWKSTDGGNNWSQVTFNSGTLNSTTITSGGSAGFNMLKAQPGVAGKLYYSCGVASGNVLPLNQPLKVSTNGGVDWTTVSGITDSQCIGFGQPVNGSPPSSGNPPVIWTMACYRPAGPPSTFAQFLANWGLWRSIDGGSTFQLQQIDGHIWPNDSAIGYATVAGDPNDYKKVYLSQNGGGYVMGKGFV